MNFIPRTPFDRVALADDSLALAAIGCTEPGFQYFPFSFMFGSLSLVNLNDQAFSPNYGLDSKLVSNPKVPQAPNK